MSASHRSLLHRMIHALTSTLHFAMALRLLEEEMNAWGHHSVWAQFAASYVEEGTSTNWGLCHSEPGVSMVSCEGMNAILGAHIGGQRRRLIQALKCAKDYLEYESTTDASRNLDQTGGMSCWH